MTVALAVAVGAIWVEVVFCRALVVCSPAGDNPEEGVPVRWDADSDGYSSELVDGDVGWSHDPHIPHLTWVRSKVVLASCGRGTCHLLADISRMRNVRRAQSQLSPISSRFNSPWIKSLSAFFSGRLSRWMVQAVCAM